MVYKCLRILAFHPHLTHVRHVEDSAMVSHCIVLFDYRRILYRHIKAAEWTDEGSQLLMLVKKTCSLVHIVI